MNNRQVIKRVFTIEFKVENFNNINDNIDLLILGIAKIKDNYGQTALILVSYQNNLEIVQALLQARASINIQDNDGWTALMFASYQNHLEVVQALIKAGVDVNIKNNYGKAALDLAGNMKIKNLLKQAGAK